MRHHQDAICTCSDVGALLDTLQDEAFWTSLQPHYGSNAAKQILQQAQAFAAEQLPMTSLPSVQMPSISVPTVQLPNLGSIISAQEPQRVISQLSEVGLRYKWVQ